MTQAVAEDLVVFGVEHPRIFTPPDRELTPATSLGFLVIDFSENVLGITLYPWQRWLYIHALELRPDGRLRFKEIHILIARQNGKTRVVKTLLLWRMFVHQRQNLILGAAQNRGEALATWEQVKEEARDNPILSKRMHRGSMKTGGETIRTQSGSRYMVTTLKADAGRGKTAGTLFLDELREHETWAAWAALSATTLVPKDSLIVTASNAGDNASVVLKEKRDHAHSMIQRSDTAGSTIGWFEWSAPEECGLDDLDAWAAANPSLGYSLEVEDLKAARAKPDNEFRTENLCQWVDTLQAGIMPHANWVLGQDRNSKRVGGERVSVSLDVSWDRSKTAISIAFDRPDGRRHVEVVAYRAGMDWAVKWLQDRLTLDSRQAKALGLPGPQRGAEWFDGRVAIQERGCPASVMIEPLEEAGIQVVRIQGPALAKSAGGFYDKVVHPDRENPKPHVIVHRGQPVLDEAIRNTLARSAGDAWFLDRKGSRSDASPLVSCTQADWLQDQPVQIKRQSAYAGDDGAEFELL